MRNVLIIFLFFTSGSSCQKNNTQQMTQTIPPVVTPVNKDDTSKINFTYLALGDSYTIGHDVEPSENFPNQTISLLQNDNLFGKVKIIATNGWTTVNLKAGIESDKTVLQKYDVVTLLIGVNNEYQGAPIANYTPEFEGLLQKSIALAGNNAGHVIVISIPDWSVTPFAGGRDRDLISKEIDAYNAINKNLAQKYNANYLDITPWTREAANDPSLLASDSLHPSGKEYARWAGKLEGIMKGILR